MLEGLFWLAALAIVCGTGAFLRYRVGIENVEKLRYEHLKDDLATQRHLADSKVHEVRTSAEAPAKTAAAQERLAATQFHNLAAEQKLVETRDAAAEKELSREVKRAALAAAKKVKS